MTIDEDRYETWDAAYVLGALSPDDRREYETHLANCERCQAAVAELAGVPGMLALVPRDEALSMVGAEPVGVVRNPAPPPSDRVLTSLADERQRQRRRSRWTTVGVAVVSAAAAVAIAVPIAGGAFRNEHDGGGSTAPSTSQVFADRGMTNLVPGPLSAAFKLIAEPGGGTRVDMRCTYNASAGVDYAGTYTMYVTDANGVESQLATWHANPGDVVTPSAVTAVPPDQIRRVDIRSAATDQVLLVGVV